MPKTRDNIKEIFCDGRADTSLIFVSSTNLIREVKNVPPNFKQTT